MNYNELCREFVLDQDWSKSTVSWSNRQLTIFGNYLVATNTPVEGVTASQFARLLNQMRKGGSSYSARNGLYTTVQKFYKWAKLNGHVDRHPFSDLDNKPKRPRRERKVVRTVDVAYIHAILRTASTYDDVFSRRDRAIVHLLATTGMRRSEVVGLSIGDVDSNAKELLLTRTKYKHERYAFLTEASTTSLERWIAVRPRCDTDRVFVTLHGSKNGLYQPMRPDAVNKLLTRLKDRSGIPSDVRITPHMFRHTFATEVAQANNPFALMELMGHTNLDSTERYIHPTKQQLRQVAKHAPAI